MPGAADRILQLAERQAAHRQRQERALLKATIADQRKDRLEVKRGQFIGASLCTLILLAGVLISIPGGSPTAGATIITGTIGGIATIFIVGRKTARDEDSVDQDPGTDSEME